MKLVCPFPAGGSSDIMARMITAPLSKAIGQQVIVENIGGAGDTIGTLKAAQSPPDGYTIVQSSIGQDAVAHGLDPKLACDWMSDFIHIAQARSGPKCWWCIRSNPIRAFGELLACIRKNPGQAEAPVKENR